MTSPLPWAGQAQAPLLAMTVLWHPEAERAGEQAIAPAGPGPFALSRFAPLFQRPGGSLRPLEYRGVAREALAIVRDGADGVRITPPASRMAVEVNGRALTGPLQLSCDQVGAGVVLRLGGTLLVCLHWMQLLPSGQAVMGVHGVSSAVVRLRNLVRQVAATDLPVLLLGETGSGKEVVANAIHAASSRRDSPFVAMNMATLSESLAAAELFGAVKGAYTGAATARSGLFAQATDGTLFLDEIGDAPPAIQPMLLRVLEVGEYRAVGAAHALRSTARVIAATDRDLAGGAPDRPSFNQPLLRRLETFVIHLPALRERREDIGLLLVHFLGEFNAQLGTAVTLSPDLVSQLCNYDWPGNVRQLANVVRRALLALQGGEIVTLDTLVPGSALAPPVPAAAPNASGPARPKRLDSLSDDVVLAAMEQSGWSILGAARALGISRPSMYKLLAANALIRPAGVIPAQEIALALARHGGDLGQCAAALRTPGEALRRRLRELAAQPHAGA